MDLTLLGQQRVGRVLRGKWHLDRLIDVGGMAAVYEATHRNGTRAAIKMLHPKYVSDVQARTRFLREGYAANRVGHLGAVSVLDDDFTEEGDVYLVMELLDGESLEATLMRETILSSVDILSIADQLLDVLTCAHAKEIIHRDIKPANIMLTRQGIVKLLDFGLARVKELPAVAGVHSTEIVFGTVAYVSPEAARANNDAMDGRADLWAVAATMFKALTGETVHGMDGSVVERLIRAAKNQARSVASIAPHLPPRVVEVVDRALMFERDDRWPSAMVMQAIVQDVLQELMEETGAPPSIFFRPGLGQQAMTPSFSPVPGAQQYSVTRSPSPRPTPYQQAAAATPSPSPYPYPRPVAPGARTQAPPSDPWGHNPLNAPPQGANNPWAQSPAPSHNPLNQPPSHNPLNQPPSHNPLNQPPSHNPLNQGGRQTHSYQTVQSQPQPQPQQLQPYPPAHPYGGGRPVTPATTQRINIQALNLDGRALGTPRPNQSTPIPGAVRGAPLSVDIDMDDEGGGSGLELTITIEDERDEAPVPRAAVPDRRTTVRDLEALLARRSLDDKLRQPPPQSSGSGFEIDVDEGSASSRSGADRVEVSEPIAAASTSASTSFVRIEVDDVEEDEEDDIEFDTSTSGLSGADPDEATLDFNRPAPTLDEPEAPTSPAHSPARASRIDPREGGVVSGEIVSGEIGGSSPSSPSEVTGRWSAHRDDTTRRSTTAPVTSEETVRRPAPAPVTSEDTVRRPLPAPMSSPATPTPMSSEDTVRRPPPTAPVTRDDPARRPAATVVPPSTTSRSEDTARIMSPYASAPGLPTLPPARAPVTMVIPTVTRTRRGTGTSTTPAAGKAPAAPMVAAPMVAAPTVSAPVIGPPIVSAPSTASPPVIGAPSVGGSSSSPPVIAPPSVGPTSGSPPVVASPAGGRSTPRGSAPVSAPAVPPSSSPIAAPVVHSPVTAPASPVSASGSSSSSTSSASSTSTSSSTTPSPSSTSTPSTPAASGSPVSAASRLSASSGLPGLPPRSRPETASPRARTPSPSPRGPLIPRSTQDPDPKDRSATPPSATPPSATPPSATPPSATPPSAPAPSSPSPASAAPKQAPASTTRAAADPLAHLRGSSNPDRTVRVAIPTPAALPDLGPAGDETEVSESMMTRVPGPEAPPRPPARAQALEVTESMITRLPDLPTPKPKKSLGPLPKLPPRKP